MRWRAMGSVRMTYEQHDIQGEDEWDSYTRLYNPKRARYGVGLTANFW